MRVFIFSWTFSTLRHSGNNLKQALISSAYVERRMTESVCLKSPERSMFCSTPQENVCEFIPDDNFALLQHYDLGWLFFMWHTAFELFWIFSGNLNAEWAVLPLSNKVAAMSDYATPNMMPLFDRISARISEMRNVLQFHLVHPKIKKDPPCPAKTTSIMQL